MQQDLWKQLLVIVAVVAIAAPALAGQMSRTESAFAGEKPVDHGTSRAYEAVWPGPDGAGYSGTMCTYSWVDISATGTSVLLGDDEMGGPFPIGFSFVFYGQTFTDFYVSSNGFISFIGGSSDLSNDCPLPSGGSPNIVALNWDDLDPGDNVDPVYYETFATCPVGTGQCLVVTYDDFCHYPGGATCDVAGTFQAILFDSGVVQIQILDPGVEAGLSATTGIEGNDVTSDHGLTFGCDTGSYLTADMCVEFFQAPFISLAPGAIAGSVCPGSTIDYDMSLFNGSGAGGTFALSYNVSTGNASLGGPPDVTVADGTSEDFVVSITPDAGLAHGDPVSGTVDANGGGFSAMSTIDLTASTDPIVGWPELPPTPYGVRFHATASHGGNIYQFGGEDGWWTFTDAVHRYDIAAGTWDTPAPLPYAAYGIGAATVGDNIYVIAGSQCGEDTGIPCSIGNFIDTVQIFDTTAETWSEDLTDPLPVALAYSSVVTDGNLIYVIGGEDQTAVLYDTLYIYDPAGADGSRWTTGTPLASPRAYTAAGYIDGMIYVAGGWLGGETVTDAVEIYDVAGGTWMAGPSMPLELSPFSAGTLGPYLVLNGSFNAVTTSTTYSCSADYYLLDTAAGTWSTHTDGLPRCLYGSNFVSADGGLYLISGRTNDGGWHMALECHGTDTCGLGDPGIFIDGFESGDTSAWASTIP